MARKAHDGFSDQFKASMKRRADAQALLDSRRWRGAMYVGGYGLECLLKASLMKNFACLTLADLDVELKNRGEIAFDASVYTHQFETLFRVAGHLERLRQDRHLWKMFNTVNLWLPAWRYNPNDSDLEEAADFLEALDYIMTWVRGNI